MQVANDIRSATKNIRYYVGQIREANSRQFDLDIQNAQLNVKLEDPVFSKNRVMVSGEIGSSCELMLNACQNIERQVEIGQKQDGK